MSSTYKTYLVGGAVRDRLLGYPFDERDWVVVGATPEIMQQEGFRPVGQDFPVFLHPQSGEEYALARTERKSGRGYGGFTFHTSPDVTLEQDLERRDLTINAMAMDDEGNLIDPYGGQEDLDKGLLRHVSPSFAEDPLRVLRVARFAARYAHLGFQIAPDTLELMRKLTESGELEHLTAERSWKEISRALLEASPHVFILTLRECGALAVLLPEVDHLFGYAPVVPDHDYADVGSHLLLVLQVAARQDLPLSARWACLLLHTDKGEAKKASQRCKVPRDCQELAVLSTEYHGLCQYPPALDPDTLLKIFKAFDIYRRPERFELFLKVCEADFRGGDGLEHKPYPPVDYLRAAAQAARNVSVESLLAQGLEGAELGKGLEREREKAVAEFRVRWAAS